MHRSHLVYLVPFIAIVGCSSGEEKSRDLQDLKLAVNFNSNPIRALGMSAQTPKVYRVKLLRATVKDTATGQAANLFAHPTIEESPTFSFTTTSNSAQTLLPSGVSIPPGNYNVLELAIVFLEMQLEFSINGSLEDRTLRIYFTLDQSYRKGDVALISTEKPSDNWAFGPGNLNGADPELMGLARPVAYQLPSFVWPDGRQASDSGPFGNQENFWQYHPENPFVQTLSLPADLTPTMVVTLRVANTWHFTDQNQDGVYQWPQDYGNDWNMDFPQMEVAEE